MMNYLKSLIAIVALSFSLFSCDKVDDVLADAGLSESEIIQGLKEALKVGTDTATGKLAATDGYLKDAAVKLLLPPEISTAITSFKEKSIDLNLLGLGNITGETIYTSGIPLLGIEPIASLEDDLILGINRAAESAANDAGPIFLDAIVGITIADGNDILFGGVDTAATTYLNEKTRGGLFNEYEPKIDAALNSVQIGNTSVVGVYEDYVAKYNGILNTEISSFTSTTVGDLMEVNAITADDLSAYATDKGLTGLFKKVADEERLIRKNPLNRVTDILTKVFGELDK
jgi:hypothetical protein